MSLQVLSQMMTALKEGVLDSVSSDRTVILLSHQKNVALRILLSYLCSGCFLWLGYSYWPLPAPNVPTQTDRLSYMVRWQTPSVVLLLAAVCCTVPIRGMTNKVDPINGPDSPRLTAHRNYLNNTLEQLVANVMAQLILTTYLETHQMQIIPLLVTLFVIGRLQYWHGYLDTDRGRSNKAFGFGMTFYVTVGVLMYCTYRFVSDLWEG